MEKVLLFVCIYSLYVDFQDDLKQVEFIKRFLLDSLFMKDIEEANVVLGIRNMSITVVCFLYNFIVLRNFLRSSVSLIVNMFFYYLLKVIN